MMGMYAEKRWRRLRGFGDLVRVMTEIKLKDEIEVTAIGQVAA